MFVGVVSSALLRSIGAKVRARMHATSRVTCVSTVSLRRSLHALPLALTLAPAEAVAVAIDSEFVDGGMISPPCRAASGAQRSRVAASEFSARYSLRQHATALEIKHIT